MQHVSLCAALWKFINKHDICPPNTMNTVYHLSNRPDHSKTITALFLGLGIRMKIGRMFLLPNMTGSEIYKVTQQQTLLNIR